MAKVNYDLMDLKNNQNETVSKTQAIRLLDVGLFGPLMIMSALNKKPPEYMRLAMLGIGIGTVIYNLYNYLEQRDK